MLAESALLCCPSEVQAWLSKVLPQVRGKAIFLTLKTSRTALPPAIGGTGQGRALSPLPLPLHSMKEVGLALPHSYPWVWFTYIPATRLSSTMLSKQGAGPTLSSTATCEEQCQLSRICTLDLLTHNPHNWGQLPGKDVLCSPEHSSWQGAGPAPLLLALELALSWCPGTCPGLVVTESYLCWSEDPHMAPVGSTGHHHGLRWPCWLHTSCGSSLPSFSTSFHCAHILRLLFLFNLFTIHLLILVAPLPLSGVISGMRCPICHLALGGGYRRHGRLP